MTSECNSCKPPFDITKSKRTRMPSNMPEPEETFAPVSSSEGSDEGRNVAEEINRRVKLKQFIKVDGSRERDQGRALLSQHFADEKRLQLVIKQPQDGHEVVKLKSIVKRYVKAFSQLVRSKRNQRLEKPVLRLREN